MTMAAAFEGTASADSWSRPHRVAAVDIIGDMSRAETIWRDLETRRASQTPYQRFDFLSAWQRQVGEREELSPVIVVAWDGERKPLALLPLARRRKHGVAVASFMGGKHANFNMAVWDRDFAASATRADLEALVAAIAQGADADLLTLYRQPRTWRELANPMALLPHQPSANDCPLLAMEPGGAPQARSLQLVPAAAARQGAQARAAARLSLSRRRNRRRRHAAARLVLSRQTAPDGRTETA